MSAIQSGFGVNQLFKNEKWKGKKDAALLKGREAGSY